MASGRVARHWLGVSEVPEGYLRQGRVRGPRKPGRNSADELALPAIDFTSLESGSWIRRRLRPEES